MPNAVYQRAGTSVTWNDSGAGANNAITLKNLAAGAGRQGEAQDWGALSTARPTLYHFRMQLSLETAGTLGERVELYWKTSDDNTIFDNDDGTGDIALSSTDKLKNLKLIGTMYTDEAAADIRMSIEGYFYDFNRYGGPVVYNATTDNLQNTTDDGSIVVTPIYDEIQ